LSSREYKTEKLHGHTEDKSLNKTAAHLNETCFLYFQTWIS